MTVVAVVTIAHGRHAHLDAQHESLALGSRRPDLYLVVAMDDPEISAVSRWGLSRHVVEVGSSDLGLPLAAARNRGARTALDHGADVVVMLDVDCLAGFDLVAAYAGAVERSPSTLWSGPVTYLGPKPAGGYPLDRLDVLDDPHPARPDPGRSCVMPGADPDLFWSLSFAVSGDGWVSVGGFCEQYVGYGGEDTDFAHLAVSRGLDHCWHGDARAYHQWHPVSSPPVEHLDDVLRNANLFHSRWDRWPMRGWLTEFERQGLAVCRDGRWVRTAAATRARAPDALVATS